ncbi:hypothetical protein SD71_21630 [Cohnella kolymensis]|uniref:Uncharacterized protein n=1 Tax=Cohnella kolymensis TaxID=1590652 RepID=A0ABR5A0M4_9BACL|nr:hypothetical protein [Cohnella kolymensis]KIL34238.1 hypothetical protein SD71_21630 [Cohnella kolymensis]
MVKMLAGPHNAKDLLRIIDNALGYNFEHDEPQNGIEADLISGFFQSIQDFADLFSDLGSGEWVRYGYEFTKTINELAEHDYLVFGAREIRILEGGKGTPSNWPIAIIHISHKDNKDIEKVGESDSEK